MSSWSVFFYLWCFSYSLRFLKRKRKNMLGWKRWLGKSNSRVLLMLIISNKFSLREKEMVCKEVQTQGNKVLSQFINHFQNDTPPSEPQACWLTQVSSFGFWKLRRVGVDLTCRGHDVPEGRKRLFSWTEPAGIPWPIGSTTWPSMGQSQLWETVPQISRTHAVKGL